ncbi:MAG: hypothetical protein WC169_11545 [Dehalococcoidia bacterium]|jgi:hypothetical protein
MRIVAFFTDNDVPAMGLSPIVNILDVATGFTVVSGESMVELGDGFYRYDFDIYEPARDYAIVCDSVTLSGSERYTYASSGEYAEVLNSIESTVGLVDTRTSLLRKIQTNRLELEDGNLDNWVLYDDDSTTPLLTFSVTDKDGQLIVQPPHTPSKRSMAAGDICGSGIAPSADIYMRKSVYDPDEDGIISVAEGISDGIYSSTASGIKYAVDNTHNASQLGSKFIDESSIEDQFVIKYDSITNKLVYANSSFEFTNSPTFSGITVSGVSNLEEMWLTDTVWDDLRVSVNSVKVGASTWEPIWTKMKDNGSGSRGVYTYIFNHTTPNEVYFTAQMPHNYKEGTDLHPHVHWCPITSGTGIVRWILEYTISNIDDVFGNTSYSVMEDAGAGTAYTHQMAEGATTISGADLTISNMMMCRLYRDATHANDTYTGSAALLEIDFHYEVDSIGSRQEYIK